MSSNTATAPQYVQVGSFALRAPNGDFLPSVPLYMQAEDAGGVNARTGLTMAEEVALTDVTKVFADKFKQYKEGVGKLERERKSKNRKNA